MIFAYIVCLCIGLASMFVTKKLSLLARFEVAIAIAVVLASAWRRKWHTDFVRMC